MDEVSKVTFSGPGPFSLSGVQRAKAHLNNGNGVTVTFDVIIEGRGPEPEAVSVQIVDDVALELALQILAISDPVGGAHKQS